MRIFFVLPLVLAAGFLLPYAFAAGTPPASIFGDYAGSTQWNIDVTEDETACGGEAPITHSRTIYIDHYIDSAIVGDWSHGSARGTFSGNALSMPARSIQDGAGTSDLEGFNIVFASDCSGFSGAYGWYYYDSEFECSGSTSLRGTRTGGVGCPGAGTPQDAEDQATQINSLRADLERVEALRQEAKDLQAEITVSSYSGASSERIAEMLADLKAKQAQLDALEAKVEAGYQEILKTDPNNFWANWDMAELRKDQGDYGPYFDYFDTAASNENIFLVTRAELELKVATDLGLPQFPTIDRSKTMRRITSDTTGWEGGWVYNVNVPKGAAADPQTWKMKLYDIFSKKAHDFVNAVVGAPGEN